MVQVLFDPWWQVAVLIASGCVAGVLGGLLGVGGSVIMIPAMVVLFGQGQRDASLSQHAYQAAAMWANVAVALPAARRHWQAGATVWPVLKWLLPTALLAVIAGVMLSDAPWFEGPDGAIWLGRVMAGFLLYVLVLNIIRLLRPRQLEPTPGQLEPTSVSNATVQPERYPAGASGLVGSLMGFVAGLLGIGGGVLAVPLQQTLLKLPLRSCIANSSAVMVVSALLGAIVKSSSLDQHQSSAAVAITMALLLAPGAIIGARIGAGLTHRLPLAQVRLVLVILLALAAWRMAHLPWP